MTEYHQAIRNPLQVKNPEELQIGKIYYCIHEGAVVDIILIRDIDRRTGRIKVDKIFPDRTVPDHSIFMQDYGILPYISGIWNSGNWILPLDETKP